MSADQNTTIRERYLERNRTHNEIRRGGAIGNLNDGIEITTHGISTRLIAWPGNGFQTESVHVLTHHPGDETPMYSYGMAEEAMLCLKGEGEVFLRGRWVRVEPGDIAYFPEGIEHASRNPESTEKEFIVVSSLSPPPFDLYEPFGLYDKEQGVMRFEAIEEAKKTARIGKISPRNELHYNDSHPELRAQNLDPETSAERGPSSTPSWGQRTAGSSRPICPTSARRTWCSTCGRAMGLSPLASTSPMVYRSWRRASTATR